MNSYVALLRGINVSGQKKIAMPELRKLLETLGFTDVSTYIQSGNIIFSTKESDMEKISKSIEQKILEKYNFHVPTIIRTAAEMTKIVHVNPFLKIKNIETSKLHVTFLSNYPNKEDLEKIVLLKNSIDEFVLIANHVFVHCRSGYGNTKLTNTFFEKKLYINATTRNWRTVIELVKLTSSI